MRLRFFALSAMVLAASAQANTAETSISKQAQEPQIDYPAFADLTVEVMAMREERLLVKEDFLRQIEADGALLLDTRSAAAFAAGHIEGAVNLPFSDFTDAKLAAVIGKDPDRAIYIYCNNNFSDDAFPIALKAAPLALNIPTFINLVGYGYENVWELDGVMSVTEVNWTGEPFTIALQPAT